MAKFTIEELAAMANLDLYNPGAAASPDEEEGAKENAPQSVHTKDDVINIPLSELHPFDKHPFQIRHDEEFDALCESIAELGILTPVIARTISDGYEIVSGHRRVEAAKTLGLSHVPVIVREMSDEEAVILMVDCNIQREDILPSERAFAYKMKLDAVKRQGARTDLTSTQFGQKSKLSVEAVAEQAGSSRNQVQRYIRLTELIPQLLDMVDDKKIAVNSAVELSYLSQSSQELVHDYIQKTGRRLWMAAAENIRHADMEDKLDYEFLDELFKAGKHGQGKIQINSTKLYKIVPPSMKKKELERLIIELLKTHFESEVEAE